MEGELYNTIQKQSEPMTARVPQEEALPPLSFIPAELLSKVATTPAGHREKCALLGLGLGALAIISWIVVLFGVFFSIFGIVLSVIGLKSNYKKYAKIGLGLSIVGFVASAWYVFAAYHGMINYNYFTSDFWGGETTSTTTTK